MVESGVFVTKKTDAMAKRVLDFYEDVRYKYLSAIEDPKEYGSAWKKAVKKIRSDFDGLGKFTSEVKQYIEEDNVFNDEVLNPESNAAKKLYDSVNDENLGKSLFIYPFRG